MVVATDTVLEERRKLLVQKRILMDLQKDSGSGNRFPHNLSELGNQVHGWTESNVELSEALRETEAFLKASRLVKEAGISEEEGDVSTSIRKHQRRCVHSQILRHGTMLYFDRH